MTRTENDLRDALRDLEQRADQHGAPSTASILNATPGDRLGRHHDFAARRFPGWLPPLAAAALVAAAAVTAVTLSSGHGGASQPGSHQPAGRRSGHTGTHRTATAPQPKVTAPRPTVPARCVGVRVRMHAPDRCAVAAPQPKVTAPRNGTTSAAAATILDDAAAKLDAASWTTPAAQDFYYVRTTEATTWTSVSGSQAGEARSAEYGNSPVPGCAHGRIVSSGESGSCTLNDVPHYRADAPTVPSAWDAYLEHIAPGAKAGGAQGKIIVQVLHQDLIAPKAAAALLRYTASCPGLHTLSVRPVAGEQLVGVTCTSMTNGSYGLAFDAGSHALVGFVVVTGNGQQSGPAEIIRQTGIVPVIGRTP